MANSLGTANTRKVSVLNIDRVPKPDQFYPHTRCSTVPITVQYKKSAPRLRRPLQDLAHIDQLSGSLQSNSQHELSFLVTCPFNHSQVEQEYVIRTEQSEAPRDVTHHQEGRLLKARMKPLWPVHISGPTAAACHGMVPERMQGSPTQPGLMRLQHELFGKTTLQLQKPSDSIHYTSLASLTGPRAK
ncbi:uncharacterized protein LOC143928241 [Lithobates pipiens]